MTIFQFKNKCILVLGGATWTKSDINSVHKFAEKGSLFPRKRGPRMSAFRVCFLGRFGKKGYAGFQLGGGSCGITHLLI